MAKYKLSLNLSDGKSVEASGAIETPDNFVEIQKSATTVDYETWKKCCEVGVIKYGEKFYYIYSSVEDDAVFISLPHRNTVGYGTTIGVIDMMVDDPTEPISIDSYAAVIYDQRDGRYLSNTALNTVDKIKAIQNGIFYIDSSSGTTIAGKDDSSGLTGSKFSLIKFGCGSDGFANPPRGFLCVDNEKNRAYIASLVKAEFNGWKELSSVIRIESTTKTVDLDTLKKCIDAGVVFFKGRYYTLYESNINVSDKSQTFAKFGTTIAQEDTSAQDYRFVNSILKISGSSSSDTYSVSNYTQEIHGEETGKLFSDSALASINTLAAFPNGKYYIENKSVPGKDETSGLPVGNYILFKFGSNKYANGKGFICINVETNKTYTLSVRNGVVNGWTELAKAEDIPKPTVYIDSDLLGG